MDGGPERERGRERERDEGTKWDQRRTIILITQTKGVYLSIISLLTAFSPMNKGFSLKEISLQLCLQSQWSQIRKRFQRLIVCTCRCKAVVVTSWSRSKISIDFTNNPPEDLPRKAVGIITFSDSHSCSWQDKGSRLGDMSWGTDEEETVDAGREEEEAEAEEMDFGAFSSIKASAARAAWRKWSEVRVRRPNHLIQLPSLLSIHLLLRLCHRHNHCVSFRLNIWRYQRLCCSLWSLTVNLMIIFTLTGTVALVLIVVVVHKKDMTWVQIVSPWG
jgi:hypothetical protein